MNEVQSVARTGEPPAEPARATRLRAWLMRALPWASLAISIAGAVEMDRSESRGGWIAAGAATSWILFVVLSLVRRPHAQGAQDPDGPLRKLLRFTTTAASQSLIHLSLLFSAPFYVEASAWTPLQCGFALVFAVATAIASWDPWCERALLHPLLGPMLLAFASFVGWNAALPMLGMPHRETIWITGIAVAFAIPALNIASGAVGRRRLSALGVGAAVPFVLALGGVRALPPAPLRVVDAAIGTQVLERKLVDPAEHFARAPGELVCWTAIRAPRGLKDGLLHVWSRDGSVLQTLVLEVRGGRRAGFRTWSRIRLPKGAHGHYRCEVVTSLGQTLGGTQVSVGER